MADKKLTAQEVLALMKSEFKKSTSTLLSSEEVGSVKTWIDMRVLMLNYIVSGDLTKGFPFGRCVEYYGDNSTGKTLLALYCAGFVQKIEGLVYYYDPECSLDKNFAIKLGADPKQIIYNDNIDTVEQFEQELEQIIKIQEISKSNQPVLVVLDSLAMLSTEHEIEKPDKEDMGRKAKLMKQITRRLTRKLAHNQVGLLILNHTIANIQTSPMMARFAPKQTTSSGSAIPFLASVRLQTKIGSKIRNNKTNEVDGITIRIQCVKNKLTRPFREGSIIFNYKTIELEKYSGLGEMLELKEIIKKVKIKNRNHYEFEGEQFVVADLGKMIEEKNWLPLLNEKLKAYDEEDKNVAITEDNTNVDNEIEDENEIEEEIEE